MKKKSTPQCPFVNLHTLIGLASVLLAVLGFGGFSAQAQSIDPLVPPLFDCSQIHSLGIDKQENLRAGAIMIFCGEAQGGSAASAGAQGGSGASAGAQALSTYGANDVDLITGPETYPNVTQSETFSAVNPDNTQQIVVAYNDSRGRFANPVNLGGASVSTDGGNTFTRLTAANGQSPFQNTFSDPVILYNRQTSTWYTVWIDGACGGGGLGGYKSTTPWDPSPASWTHYCVHSGSFDDRESGWVDNNPSSPFYGRMYVSWNDFASTTHPEGIFASYSSDGGNTWTEKFVGGGSSPFIRNVQITGDPVTGDLYIAGMNEGTGVFNTARNNLVFRSTDGGNTWTNTYTGPTFNGPGRSQNGYFACMYSSPSPGYWRHEGWGQIAAINHVVHYDYAAHGTIDPGNVFYIRSTDSGVTFSAPFQLNTDSELSKAQWEPNLSVTPNGTVFAVWYDERNGGICVAGSNTPCYQMFARKSIDNGMTWLPDDTFSDVVSPLPAQPDPGIVASYVGDYDYQIGVATGVATTQRTAWVDGRVPINVYQQDAFTDSEPGPAVVSRKKHGTAGNFDVNLPRSRPRGVECRTPGSLPDSTSGDYELIFTFPNPLSRVASVSVSCGSVSSSFIGPKPDQYTVILSGETACNQNYVTVTLTGVVDNQGNTAASVPGTMGLLWGDVDANGVVDGNDVSAVQGQSGYSVGPSNFREDVTVNGYINSSDISFTQAYTRTRLPSPP
jgi:hypothetical protein